VVTSVLCVVYSSDSVELRTPVAVTSDRDTVDSLMTTHDMPVTSTINNTVPSVTSSNTVPSVTSSVSVMIRHTDNSDIASRTQVRRMQFAASAGASVGPHISTTSDGSLVLTLSYSPSVLDTVSDDRPSVHNAAVSSTAADSDVHRSAVSSSSINSSSENSATQRFVCLCFTLSQLCILSFPVSLSQ